MPLAVENQRIHYFIVNVGKVHDLANKPPHAVHMTTTFLRVTFVPKLNPYTVSSLMWDELAEHVDMYI